MNRNLFAWAAVFMIAAPHFVSAQSVSLRSSAQYATGDYIFVDRTESIYLSVGVSLYSPRFSVGVDLPFVYQSSPYVTYGLVSPVPTGGPRSDSVSTQRGDGHHGRDGGSGSGGGGDGGAADAQSRSTLGISEAGIAVARSLVNSSRSDPVIVPDDTVKYNQFGFSDPVFSVGATLVQPGLTHPSVLLLLTVKTPIASVENGFSTGAPDYSAGLSSFFLKQSLFAAASVTYFINGDLETLALKNSIGISGTIGRNWKAGTYSLYASGYYSTAIIEGVDAPLSVSTGFAYSKLPFSLTLGASKGLSESTPGFSMSVGLQRTL